MALIIDSIDQKIFLDKRRAAEVIIKRLVGAKVRQRLSFIDNAYVKDLLGRALIDSFNFENTCVTLQAKSRVKFLVGYLCASCH